VIHNEAALGRFAPGLPRFTPVRRSCLRRTMSGVNDDARALEGEAIAFTRYLLGRTPPAELVARYSEASRVLFGAPASPADAAVLGFARRHPWSVGYLDAAAGLLRPAGLLRAKILVMSAILETSPAFADEFLPRSVPPFSLAVQLVVSGTAAVVRTAVGVALHAAAVRPRGA